MSLWNGSGGSENNIWGSANKPGGIWGGGGNNGGSLWNGGGGSSTTGAPFGGPSSGNWTSSLGGPSSGTAPSTGGDPSNSLGGGYGTGMNFNLSDFNNSRGVGAGSAMPQLDPNLGSRIDLSQLGGPVTGQAARPWQNLSGNAGNWTQQINPAAGQMPWWNRR